MYKFDGHWHWRMCIRSGAAASPLLQIIGPVLRRVRESGILVVFLISDRGSRHLHLLPSRNRCRRVRQTWAPRAVSLPSRVRRYFWHPLKVLPEMDRSRGLRIPETTTPTSMSERWVAEKYPELVARVGQAQANQAISSLRAVLNWVIGNKELGGALSKNPVNALKRKMHRISPRTNCLERSQLKSWWAASQTIENVTARAYLQFLLLTGARREEALSLRWIDIDLNWKTCTFQDTKNGEKRVIPLTEHTARIFADLPRKNEWVFFSPTSASGRMKEPAKPIGQIAARTGLHISSHDLRRSFATLAEWCELPDGAVKQLIGHKPRGVTEAHYKRRPIDLLRSMLQRYENFVLTEATAPMESTQRTLMAA